MNDNSANNLVLAVLLNYNQNDYTLKCVESLLNSDYLNLKIILIDNGSTKENVEKLISKLPKSEKLIFRKLKNNIGLAQGTNFGLNEGLKLKPEYYLIMNNDTIIDKSAINELVKTCKEYNDKAIVTGKVYHYEEPKNLQIVGYELKNKNLLVYKQLGLDEKDQGQYDSIQERDMIDDIYVLHPVNIFKTIGGYSQYLWVNGVNIDMALRVRKMGYKLIYTPNAKLWHKGSVSVGGRNRNPKLAYWNIQSSLILRYLYLSKPNFLLYYFTIVNSIIRTCIKSIYSKFFGGENLSQYAKAKYKGLTYFNKWIFFKKANNGQNPF